MKVEVSIKVKNLVYTVEGPFVNSGIQMILDVEQENPIEMVSALILAVEDAVRKIEKKK